MEPYAGPKQRKVGKNRPKIQHLAPDPTNPRTRRERLTEKEGVTSERRAIKKSARRQLQAEMIAEVEAAR
ncbi:MAG: hypothetical protein M3Z22_00975 [Verrucomicrobiota bacterium]|nr:hypothetical protein [Verrucomicrobiota bacterium]